MIATSPLLEELWPGLHSTTMSCRARPALPASKINWAPAVCVGSVALVIRQIRTTRTSSARYSWRRPSIARRRCPSRRRCRPATRRSDARRRPSRRCGTAAGVDRRWPSRAAWVPSSRRRRCAASARGRPAAGPAGALLALTTTSSTRLGAETPSAETVSAADLR